MDSSQKYSIKIDTPIELSKAKTIYPLRDGRGEEVGYILFNRKLLWRTRYELFDSRGDKMFSSYQLGVVQRFIKKHQAQLVMTGELERERVKHLDNEIRKERNLPLSEPLVSKSNSIPEVEVEVLDQKTEAYKKSLLQQINELQKELSSLDKGPGLPF